MGKILNDKWIKFLKKKVTTQKQNDLVGSANFGRNLERFSSKTSEKKSHSSHYLNDQTLYFTFSCFKQKKQVIASLMPWSRGIKALAAWDDSAFSLIFRSGSGLKWGLFKSYSMNLYDSSEDVFAGNCTVVNIITVLILLFSLFSWRIIVHSFCIIQ